MQIETELVHIVTPTTRKKIKVFWKSPGSFGESLYTGLRKGQISDDLSAALAVFGEPDSSVRFRAFRARFRERLLNSLFFLELTSSRHGALGVDLYRLHKQVFWVHLLAMFGARNSAVAFCKKALKTARFYHQTLIEVDMMDFLCRHYWLQGHPKLHSRLSAKLDKKLATLQAEQSLSRMYQTLSMAYVKSAVPREVSNQIAIYNERASELASRFQTYNTTQDSIRIQILYNQVSGNYFKTLEVCDIAERYFKEHDHLTPVTRYGELEMHRLESYLYLRDYEHGSQSALKCASYFPVGRNNWFTYMEYYFLLAMHTLRFERAIQIYTEVTSHPRFTLQRDALRERWRVFQICLNYANRATRAPGQQQVEIDVDHLLQTVPIYTKDKQGYNVPILVMHILLLLERGDLDAITQRMEALKTYRSRYLRAKTNKHSALFFKLLMIMEANSFNYEEISKKGAKYYEQLRTLPSAYTEVHEGVQILSYAWLWERVLERLEIMQDTLILR
jgi:hypothetical protein